MESILIPGQPVPRELIASVEPEAPSLVPGQPVPAALIAKPPQHPLLDLSVADLAADDAFDPVQYAADNFADLSADPALLDRLAEVDRIRMAGFNPVKFAKGAASGLVDTVARLPEMGAQIAQTALESSPVTANLIAAAGMGKLDPEVALALQTEAAVTTGASFEQSSTETVSGLKGLAEKGVAKVVRELQLGAAMATALGDKVLSPDTAAALRAGTEEFISQGSKYVPEQRTPEEARNHFLERASMRAELAAVGEGRGVYAKAALGAAGTDVDALAQQGIQIDPQAVEDLKLVTDVTEFIPAGKGFSIVAKGGRKILTAPTKALAAKGLAALRRRAASATRRASQVAQQVSKAPPIVTAVAGAALGDVTGAAGGAGIPAAARAAAPALEAGAQMLEGTRKIPGSGIVGKALRSDAVQGVVEGLAAPFSPDLDNVIPLAAAAGQGTDAEMGAAVGSTAAFGAAGGFLGAGAPAVRSAAEATVRTRFSEIERTPIAETSYGTDPQLDADHAAAMGALETQDPSAANALRWLKATALPSGAELYLLPKDRFSAVVGAAVGAPAGSQFDTPGFIQTGADGRQRIYLNETATALGHEVGHALVAAMDPQTRAQFFTELRGAFSPEQLNEFGRYYDSLLGRQQGAGNSMLLGGQDRILDELAAEVLTKALYSEPLNGLPVPLVQRVHRGLASLLETVGLYRPDVMQGGQPGATALGVTPTTGASDYAMKWLRERQTDASWVQGKPPVLPPEAPRPAAQQPPQPRRMSRRTFLTAGMSADRPVSPAANTPGTSPAANNPPPAPPAVPPVIPPAAPQPAPPVLPPAAPQPAPPVIPTPEPAPTTAAERAQRLQRAAQTEEQEPQNMRVTPEQQAVLDANRRVSGADAAEAAIAANPGVYNSEVYSAIDGALQRPQGQVAPVRIVYDSVRPDRGGNRDARVRKEEQDAAYEAERQLAAMPSDIRARFSKATVPYRWVTRPGREGAPANVNLLAMSLDKVLANLDRVISRAGARNSTDLIPYAVNNGVLTTEAARQFADDLQRYTTNQANGYAGTGAEVTVPPGYQGQIPERNPSYRPQPVPQERADFLNLLMAISPPATARVTADARQRGSIPNVEARRLAEANRRPVVAARTAQAGRGVYPARPEVGVIQDTPIAEPNPLRDQFAQRGVDFTGRTLFQVTEELDLQRIRSATPMASSGFRAPSKDLIQAGFMPDPKSESGGAPDSSDLGAFIVAGTPPRSDLREALNPGLVERHPPGTPVIGPAWVASDGTVFALPDGTRYNHEESLVEGDEGDAIDYAPNSVLGGSLVGGVEGTVAKFGAVRVTVENRAPLRESRGTPGEVGIMASRYGFTVAQRRAIEGLLKSADSVAIDIVGDDGSVIWGFVYPGYDIIKARRAINQLSAKAGSRDQFMPAPETQRGIRQPSPVVRDIATGYMRQAGMSSAAQHTVYAPIDTTLSARLADAYEAAKHAPQDPAVRAAYRALIDETRAQWDYITAAGYQLLPWTQPGQPYTNSDEMIADVRDNKRLYFFTTDGGFGTDPNGVPVEHPLLEPTGITIEGKQLVANDLFRAVHDFFGHAKEGYQFGPRGELNAYLAHATMFTPEAGRALAAETLGQNSWVNFGRHLRGADGRVAERGQPGFVPVTERPFADQKAFVFPQELIATARRAGGRFMPYIGIRGSGMSEDRMTRRSEAIDLEEAGKSPEEIRQTTGWFRNPYDNQWRYELADDGARITPEYDRMKEVFFQTLTGEPVPLPAVLEHPTLFEAYPRLKAVRVQIKALAAGSRGYFDGNEELIAINATLDADAALRTLTHEIQHAIQDYEGFARGSNQTQFLYEEVPAEYYTAEESDTLRQLETEEAALNAQRDAISAYFRSTPAAEKRSPESMRRSDELRQTLDRLGEVRIKSSAIRRRVRAAYTFDRYRRTAGEVEARDAANRVAYSAARRMVTRPYEAEGVSPSSAVVLYDESQSHFMPTAAEYEARRALEAKAKTKANKAPAIRAREVKPVAPGTAQLGGARLPANYDKKPEVRAVRYSSRSGSPVASPQNFGRGVATASDKRGLPKVYFYEENSPTGADRDVVATAGKTKYGARLSTARLYDVMGEDPLDYLSTVNREVADRKLVDAGYAGLRIVSGDGRRIIALFEPVAQTELGKAVKNEARATVPPGAPKFMPRPSDAAHAAAVEVGDTERARAAVDSAARAAGLGRSRLNNAGTPERMYSGSGWSAHNVFERGKSPAGGTKPNPGYGLDDIGHWFTSSQPQATAFGSVLQMDGTKRPPAKLYEVFLDIQNPLEFADNKEFRAWVEDYAQQYAFDDKSRALRKGGRSVLGALNADMLRERLRLGGKDGIIIWKGDGDGRFGLQADESWPTWAVALEPNQIKSAEPATYDDTGELIPLSERFNRGTPDQRFMPRAVAPPRVAKTRADIDRATLPPGQAEDLDWWVSQRIPTAKGYETQGLENDLIVGTEDVLEYGPKAARQFKKIAGMGDLRGSAAEVITAARQRLVDNLLYMHDSMPAEVRERARLWYNGARVIAERFAKEFGVSTPQAAAVLATLSPQKDWPTNVELAEMVLHSMTRHQDTRTEQVQIDWLNDKAESALADADPGDSAAEKTAAVNRRAAESIEGRTLAETPAEFQPFWVRAYWETIGYREFVRDVAPEGAVLQRPALTETGNPFKVRWQKYGAIAKSMQAVVAPSRAVVSSLLGGEHKVRNFFNNILLPDVDLGDITVDTHAIAAALYQPLSGADVEVGFGLGGIGGQSIRSGSGGAYGVFADAYREAARQRGLLAREMQSITWEAVRSLFLPGFKRNKKNGAAVKQLLQDAAAGKMTYDEARQQIEALAGGFRTPSWFGQ